MDPEALKVRDWRHKLQKSFFSAKLPKDEVGTCTVLKLKLIAIKEMPILHNVFTAVENYDRIIQYLSVSP